MSFSVEKVLTARERKILYRSLSILAKSLEGRLTTVDLRNESSVSGMIKSVDACMNISLEDVAYVEYEGIYKYFAQVFVPARMVRDIVIPNDVSITQLLRESLPSSKRVKDRGDGKPRKTFKEKRAMANQQETLRLIKELQEKKSTPK